MRLGIVLPADGPLAEPDAVCASGHAAEDLGYGSVWAHSLGQLSEVAAWTQRVPLGLMLPERDRRPVGGHELGPRLAYVAAREPELGALWGTLPTSLLLDASDVAPDSDRVDGWAPPGSSTLVLPAQWRTGGRLLVLRVTGPPTPLDLRTAAVARVDELVVALPAAVTLDEQLAAFADIAERLPVSPQPAG